MKQIPDSTAVLTDLFLAVAEKAAFLLGFPVDRGEYRPAGGEWLRVALSLGGEVDGRLTLWLPERAARGMAADLLGVEPDDLTEPGLARDAAGELLNVVAGQAATALLGPDADYRLSLPEVVRDGEPAVREALARPEALLFDVEGCFYLLLVEMKEA